MSLRDLQKRREQHVAEMRALHDQMGDDATPEQSERWTKLEAERERLDERIKREALLDEADRQAQGRQVAGDRDWRDLEARIRTTDAVRLQLGDASLDRGPLDEFNGELRNRGVKCRGVRVPTGSIFAARPKAEEYTAVTSSGPAGGFLVPTEHRADLFIDVLRPNTILGGLGARFVNLETPTGDLSIPRMTSLSPSVEWIAENAPVTGGTHTFGTLSATPHTMAVKATWSRRMMLQSDPGVEQLVRDDFSSKASVEIDRVGLMGTGLSSQPEGILSNSDISSVTITASPAVPSWAEILEAIATAQAANAMMGSLGWALNPFVAKLLRSTVRVDSTDSVFIMNSPTSLADYPARVSTQLPGDPNSSPVVDGKLLFGSFSELVLLFWGGNGVDVLVNPYGQEDFDRGNVSIRAFVDMDVVLRHPESFVQMVGIAV